MKYLRFKLKILWYGIRANFSLKKELKLTFLLSCFVKLAPDHQVPQDMEMSMQKWELFLFLVHSKLTSKMICARRFTEFSPMIHFTYIFISIIFIFSYTMNFILYCHWTDPRRYKNPTLVMSDIIIIDIGSWDFKPSHCKDSYKYSFFPLAIVQWNALPANAVISPNLVSFKAAVGELQHPKP